MIINILWYSQPSIIHIIFYHTYILWLNKLLDIFTIIDLQYDNYRGMLTHQLNNANINILLLLEIVFNGK